MFKKFRLKMGDHIARRIAKELNKFMYEYDPYEYRDSIEDYEQGYQTAYEVIKEDSIDCFRIEDYLAEIAEDEESPYRYDAKRILRKISTYRKFLFRYQILLA